MRVEIKGEPEPIRDLSTAEAAAEFKRKRDAGNFGCRNQAEYLEMQRMADLFDKYEDVMDGEEFWARYAAGTLPELPAVLDGDEL